LISEDSDINGKVNMPPATALIPFSMIGKETIKSMAYAFIAMEIHVKVNRIRLLFPARWLIGSGLIKPPRQEQTGYKVEVRQRNYVMFLGAANVSVRGMPVASELVL
jgi:hypothetical protein